MPTLKQEQTVKDLLENTGKPISRAMLDNGYSPATAKNPCELTESKGWKELLEKYLPDEKLLKKHDEALEAKKWNDFTGEREEDHSIRLKAIELGYKLKGKLNEGSVNISGEKVIAILGGITNDIHNNNGDSQNSETK